MAANDIRQCLVTRERRPAAEMLRFVLDPEGAVVPDVRRRLPGRGVWVTADKDRLAEAVRRRLFGRGFRREVRVDADLPETVDRLLREEVVGALSLARKSGLVVTGFEKTRSRLLTGDVGALIAASDGADDGRTKLLRLARASAEGHNPLPVVDVLESEALSGALGGERVVHGALLRGGLTTAICAKVARLGRYRGVPVPTTTADITNPAGPDARITETSSEQEAV